jgi:tRNA dimethylallyltransferase
MSYVHLFQVNGLNPPAIFLMGPTASGKTGVAVQLVQRLPLEIVSVDSALVYRGMDIGTAKPDAATLGIAPHHLIDLIDPTEAYSAARFREDALRVMAEITARSHVPLLVGGTMLYFKALWEGLSELPQADAELREAIEQEARERGWPALHAELAQLDPETAARLKPADAQRIQRALEVVRLTGAPMSALLIPSPSGASGEFAEQGSAPAQPGEGATSPVGRAGGGGALPYRVLALALVPSDRSVLHARIAQRFAAMLEAGLVEEVKHLCEKYPLKPGLPSMRCVGYRQAWQHLDGEYDRAELLNRGIYATRQLAKRQLTWLRGMEVETLDCLAGDRVALVEARVWGFLGEGGQSSPPQPSPLAGREF